MVLQRWPALLLSQARPRPSSIRVTLRFQTLTTTSFLAHPARRMAAVAQVAVPATGKTISVSTGLFINNQFVPSVDSKETIECVFCA